MTENFVRSIRERSFSRSGSSPMGILLFSVSIKSLKTFHFVISCPPVEKQFMLLAGTCFYLINCV